MAAVVVVFGRAGCLSAMFFDDRCLLFAQIMKFYSRKSSQKKQKKAQNASLFIKNEWSSRRTQASLPPCPSQRAFSPPWRGAVSTPHRHALVSFLFRALLLEPGEFRRRVHCCLVCTQQSISRREVGHY